ncbi:hypothetical protein A5625_15290 [Mycobacterium sp. 1465703.0]|nr:hypothetical protein A5625_15290 [Mycobacterium sp. 1465703.0]
MHESTAPTELGELRLDARCPGGKLHFRVIDGERIEVKCTHWQCTESGKFVAIHRYSFDGELLETLKFKDPQVRGRRAQTTHRKEHP